MTAPVIGITGGQPSVSDDFPETLGHLRSDVFIAAYSQSIARAEGTPTRDRVRPGGNTVRRGRNTTAPPGLGICRDIQLINVALGGSVVSDPPVGDGASHAFLGYPAWHP